jgi:hypothetical protein
MAERLGDKPIDQKYRDKMNAVAEALDRTFNGEAHGAEQNSPMGLNLAERRFREAWDQTNDVGKS